MPDLNVCTGKAFAAGSLGELVVAGSNSHAWTLSGSMAANNGLNTDPAGGLWTAPHGCYYSYQEQSASSLSQALAASPWNVPLTSPTFANPSSASRMRLRADVHARLIVNANASSLGQVSAGAQFTGGVSTTTPGVPIPNSTTAAVTGLWVSITNQAEVLVNAGATATLGLTISAWLIGGTVTVTAWVVGVHFYGWLLDPTQAGGIS